VIPNSLFPAKSDCNVGLRTLQSSCEEAYMYGDFEQIRFWFWLIGTDAIDVVLFASMVGGKRDVQA
jgi:hypothetical protein